MDQMQTQEILVAFRVEVAAAMAVAIPAQAALATAS